MVIVPKKIVALVTDGPSRQSMLSILSCMKEYDNFVKFSVLFGAGSIEYIQDNLDIPISESGETVVSATMTGVSWEDGSGQSFNLMGHALFINDKLKRWFSFAAYFQTANRIGHMAITIN